MSENSVFIEKSLSGASWFLPDAQSDVVERIMRKHDVPELIARLLVIRGISEDAVKGFLEPTLADDFPDPLQLKGMTELADDLSDAVIQGKKIGVFGDFDVDGATSTAIAVRFFKALGIDVPFYIPDRLKEGYGPNVDALRSLKEQGAEIILICDCGITAFDVIAQAKEELDVELVILDHHEAEEQLPVAQHVIDPKRQDDDSDLDMLAACGVVFLTCVALNAALREKGYYKDKGIKEPSLKNWMDLLALGTVCDMVPLQGPNRLFVRKGFEQLSKRTTPGIAALANVAGLKGDITPYHAGFILGPRINAGSRIHKSDLGAQLLSWDDEDEVLNIAWTLNDCNDRRKEIEAEMLEHAIGMVENGKFYDQPIIMVGDESWHPGLSGLVAGRLKEKYGKPAVAVTYAKTESGKLEGRGSGRSIDGVSIGQAFIDARHEGLLIKGGGHAMAAGFTLDPSKEEELRNYLYDHIQKQLSGSDITIKTYIDCLTTVRGASVRLVKMIHEQFGPFGQGHDEPIFLFENIRLHMVDTVGKDHIRAMISDWEGGPRIKAMAFRSADTKMGQALLMQGKSQPFHLLGTLKVDNWSGEDRVELHIKDAYPVMEREQNGADQQVA